MSTLVCAGCGAAPAPAEPYPFRCPNVGRGDVDHVLVRRLDGSETFDHGGDQPFVRFRGLLHSFHRATAGGIGDPEFVQLVQRLDGAVAALDGHGFSTTPFGRSTLLSDRLGFSREGGVWVKDETRNVAGSHKGRHLMGVMLHVEVAHLLGQASDPPDLAIASCGNAALAAAVIARAAGRCLHVFVPVGADPAIERRLRELGADVVVCPRPGGITGDPTYAALRTAVASGAVPFTCQGNQNGLVIEGGETLGWEMATAGTLLDHLVVQVGGGALASACIQAFGEAVRLGVLPRGPRIHTVQTAGAHPLERAYHRVRDRLPPEPSAADIAGALREAATHRSAYMWPWETAPASMATGILDDETYDWRAVVGGMLETGGQPVVVSEERLGEAHRLGTEDGVPVDPTGTAGLAGLLDLREAGVVKPDERVAVLFTGVQREGVGDLRP